MRITVNLGRSELLRPMKEQQQKNGYMLLGLRQRAAASQSSGPYLSDANRLAALRG